MLKKQTIKTITVASTTHNQIIDITREISSFINSSKIFEGICFVYIPHTTAGITINENADPDVKTDILKGLDHIVNLDLAYDHAEGNSPAHIKASIIGNSVSVFVENGNLVLGTWQGIYFCEFDGPRTRNVYVKIMEG